MKRIVSKYGAYTNHILALSTDSSVKAPDHAKLKDYYSKWTDAKYLLGCALFVDLLKPCASFSKSMQNEEIDILGALQGLLKTIKEVENLGKTSLEQWPTYSSTIAKCVEEEGDSDTVYQLQHLKRFNEAKDYYSSKYDYCSHVTQCIKARLAWSDLQLMRDIILFLGSY